MKNQKQREEATKRKNEKQTMMKAVVSIRAIRQLYEKEKSLCDTLISHLEKLHSSLVHLPEIQGAASTDKEPVVSLSASKMNMVHATRPASYSPLFIHVLLIGIVVKGTGGDVISNCDKVNSCLETYPDIYYTLASDEKSFKIESALYPLKNLHQFVYL